MDGKVYKQIYTEQCDILYSHKNASLLYQGLRNYFHHMYIYGIVSTL